VPDGKLERIPNLLQRVIQPAVLEVNGLADFGVKIEPIRKGGSMRGLVTGFRVSWWRKDVPDLQAAYSELKRPKVGRTARLRGLVETTEPIEAIPPALQQKIDATVTEMRRAGAPESDIEQFMKSSGATAQ
jgi:hypothetical protein